MRCVLTDLFYCTRRYKGCKELLTGYMEKAERMLDSPAEDQIVGSVTLKQNIVIS